MKEKSLFRVLCFGFIILAGVPAANGSDYVYNHEHSAVRFTLKHVGMITVEGRFREFSGGFQFDRAHIEKCRVNISIRTPSVDSANPMRDEHLRSKKFFWSDKYPDIHFESTNVKNIRGESFDIHGNLTIRGITKPAIFHTELCCEVPDGRGGKRLLFNAEAVIRRKDYNLGTGGLMDPIMLLTNEELKIILEIQGVTPGA